MLDLGECFNLPGAFARIFKTILGKCDIPVSILYKSISVRYRPVRARYRFIQNASWDTCMFPWTSRSLSRLKSNTITAPIPAVSSWLRGKICVYNIKK